MYSYHRKDSDTTRKLWVMLNVPIPLIMMVVSWVFANVQSHHVVLSKNVWFFCASITPQ